MKAIVLILIWNLPNGESKEMIGARNLSMTECRSVAETIWAIPSAPAYWDDQGPVPEFDAACITMDEFNR